MTDEKQTGEPGADSILATASRLITVATRCVWSFGAAEGLNDALLASDDPHGGWRQPVAVLHRDALMMVVIRVAILLDRDAEVSFQTIHRLLKDPEAVAVLLHTLENRDGPDILTPSRTCLIEDYFRTYSRIDWKVHGRLMHLRNLGIAHLTPEEMRKSVTIAELRTLVEIISRLTATLQHLCQSQTAFRTDMVQEYRALTRKVIKTG
jgi:hypothetical protein